MPRRKVFFFTNSFSHTFVPVMHLSEKCVPLTCVFNVQLVSQSISVLNSVGQQHVAWFHYKLFIQPCQMSFLHFEWGRINVPARATAELPIIMLLIVTLELQLSPCQWPRWPWAHIPGAESEDLRVYWQCKWISTKPTQNPYGWSWTVLTLRVPVCYNTERVWGPYGVCVCVCVLWLQAWAPSVGFLLSITHPEKLFSANRICWPWL